MLHNVEIDQNKCFTQSYSQSTKKTSCQNICAHIRVGRLRQHLRGLSLWNWLCCNRQNVKIFQMKLSMINSNLSTQVSSDWMRQHVFQLKLTQFDANINQMISDRETNNNIESKMPKLHKINTHITWGCHTWNFDTINTHFKEINLKFHLNPFNPLSFLIISSPCLYLITHTLRLNPTPSLSYSNIKPKSPKNLELSPSFLSFIHSTPSLPLCRVA